MYIGFTGRQKLVCVLVPEYHRWVTTPESAVDYPMESTLEHLQPFAPPTAESSGNYRRIGRKLCVGSAELPAGAPAICPEIGVFNLFLQIDVPVRRISYSLPTFGSNKHQFGESHTVKQNKQIN
jgi:hypothetical protein